MKINKHIEIVSSTRIGLSSMSKKSRESIRAALAKHYTDVGITIVNDLQDLENLVAHRPDLVFLGMKFIPKSPDMGRPYPNKLWITDFLDEQEIPYTGSGSGAHELELNKHLAKQRALDVGLITSPFYVALQNQPQIRGNMLLNFPLFIKPTNRGGGLGIDYYSVAHNFAGLESKILSITADHQSDALVEEYLPGREFSVAILKEEHSDGFSIMPLELIAPSDNKGMRYLSADIKSADTERFVEIKDKDIKLAVSGLAIDIFHALGAQDYGRIDIRMDAYGAPHFLEANLIPSLLKGYGNFPKACWLNKRLDYESMLLRIVRLALSRQSLSDRRLTDDFAMARADLSY